MYCTYCMRRDNVDHIDIVLLFYSLGCKKAYPNRKSGTFILNGCKQE